MPTTIKPAITQPIFPAVESLLRNCLKMRYRSHILSPRRIIGPRFTSKMKNASKPPANNRNFFTYPTSFLTFIISDKPLHGNDPAPYFLLSLKTYRKRASLQINGIPSKICLYSRSEEHTSELQSRFDLVCRLLLEKKNNILSH